MASIIKEIQAEILGGQVSIASILRKSLLVAKNLDFQGMEKWIESELNGISGVKDIPLYRHLTSRVKAKFPRGYLTVPFGNSEIERMITNVPIGLPIAEIEAVINRKAGDANNEVLIPFSAGENNVLNSINPNEPMEFAHFFTSLQFVRIIETVKTTLFKWVVDLEKNKILGEGMAFSAEEKKQAGSTTFNIINNFHGDVTGSQIQQGTTHSSQDMKVSDLDLEKVEEFVWKISSSFSGLGLEKIQQDKILSEIASIKAELKTSKPKFSVIKGCLKVVVDVLKHTAGHLAAELTLHFHEYFPNL